jgi:glycosyltransferase involved in cell wall biosynthesis
VPLLTILTVTKNPGYEVIRTVKSVLSQSFKDYEYIVVDANSVDGTYEYLKKLKKEKKIKKLILQKSKGIYQAINEGIKASKGKFIGIIHAADSYTKEIFFKLNKSFNDKNDIIFGSGNLLFDFYITKLHIKSNAHKKLDKSMSILHPSTFVKAEVYKNLNFYNKSFKIAADYDFFKKALNNNYKFFNTKLVISDIKFGGISSQLKNSIIIAQELAMISNNHKDKNLILSKFLFFFFRVFFDIAKKKIRNNLNIFNRLVYLTRKL